MAAVPASISLVGCGPGDKGLLTTKAVDRLSKAEVCLYDAFVGADILEMVKKNCEKIYVGKRKGDHAMPQDELNKLMVKKVKEGKKVVRLKGGDPMVFGRGGEEAKHLKKFNITPEVIPGVTAASAAAADTLTSLTTRGVARNLVLSTAVDKTGGLNTSWFPMLPTSTVCLYMGTSAASELCRKLLSLGAPPTTPLLVVRNASLPTSSHRRSTISEISEMQPDAKLISDGERGLLMLGQGV
eukprot:TRINITY_DN2179_c0_g2_i1.p1 TRINITY_DN2179_c0_g2~~TRINITY_DN2179_c0_g2_i1.p1  ORF type:complete len:259 (+),score=45.45 TRINITY_DN2179_c0_g2_i1:55-777(+)